jgi:hypothetical protein
MSENLLKDNAVIKQYSLQTNDPGNSSSRRGHYDAGSSDYKDRFFRDSGTAGCKKKMLLQLSPRSMYTGNIY